MSNQLIDFDDVIVSIVGVSNGQIACWARGDPSFPPLATGRRNIIRSFSTGGNPPSGALRAGITGHGLLRHTRQTFSLLSLADPSKGNSASSSSNSTSQPRSSARPAAAPKRRASLPEGVALHPPTPSEIVSNLSRSLMKLGLWMVKDLPRIIVVGLWKFLRLLLTNPKHIWEVTKHEAKHYYHGFKQLYMNTKSATTTVRRVLKGHQLTRRERRQLVTTMTDLFRLFPFSFFIIIPGAELLLPFAIKMFPGMLPSTFADKAEEEVRRTRELQYQIELAKFLQDTYEEIGHRIAEREDKRESPNEDKAQGARQLIKLMQRVRRGETLDTRDIVKVASLFKDELTLNNLGRPQLVVLANFFQTNSYLPDPMLRFQLRVRIRRLKEDDQRILWEGLESFSKDELARACHERGMRSTGLTREGYEWQLRQWLDLSINKAVPASLLILSRAFTITAVKEDAGRALQQSISEVGEDVVREAVLATSTKPAPPAEKKKVSSAEAQPVSSVDDAWRAEKEQEQDEEQQQQQEEEEDEEGAEDRAGARLPAGGLSSDPREMVEELEAAGREVREVLQKMRLESIDRQADMLQMELEAKNALAEARRMAADAALQAKQAGSHSDMAHAQEAAAMAARRAAQLQQAHGASLLAQHEKTLGRARQLAGDDASGSSISADGADMRSDLSEQEVEALRVMALESAVLRERAVLARIRGARMQLEANKMMSHAYGSGSTTIEDEAALPSPSEGSTPAPASKKKPEKPAKAKGEEPPAQSEEVRRMERVAARVRGRLDHMLEQIEGELEQLEGSVADSSSPLTANYESSADNGKKPVKQDDGTLDKNQDGMVTSEDLRYAILRIQSILSNKDSHDSEVVRAAEKVVRQLDRDADGKVSVEDILRYCASPRNAEMVAQAVEVAAEAESRKFPTPESSTKKQ